MTKEELMKIKTNPTGTNLRLLFDYLEEIYNENDYIVKINDEYYSLEWYGSFEWERIDLWGALELDKYDTYIDIDDLIYNFDFIKGYRDVINSLRKKQIKVEVKKEEQDDSFFKWLYETLQANEKLYTIEIDDQGNKNKFIKLIEKCLNYATENLYAVERGIDGYLFPININNRIYQAFIDYSGVSCSLYYDDIKDSGDKSHFVDLNNVLNDKAKIHLNEQRTCLSNISQLVSSAVALQIPLSYIQDSFNDGIKNNDCIRR